MFEELNLGYCSSLNLTKSSFIAKGTTRNQLALLPEVQTVTTWTSNSESGGLLPLLVFLQNVSNKQKKKIRTTNKWCSGRQKPKIVLGPEKTPSSS